jgi:bacterial/archaeal transporter family-2 protein
VAVAAPAADRHVGALAVVVASGALVALQARVNGELGVRLDDALLAAVVSFGTGLAVVAAVVLARPEARRRLPLVGSTRRWHRLGGLGGATLVGVGAFAAPRLGVALLTVGIVAGQTTGGLAVDRAGLGPAGARPLDRHRVAGAGLCLLAVALAGTGRGTGDADPLLLLLVVLSGFLVAVQQALNGRVRAATGDASVATLLNFVVGTVALVGAWLLTAAVTGAGDPAWPGEWWLYVGGPIGATFVAVAAVVVARVGVLRLGLALVAGQLVGAVLLDVLAPATDSGLAAATVVGTALTFVAVLVSGRSR